MPAGHSVAEADIRDLSSVAGATQGLSWSWDLDFEALLAALDGPAPWLRQRRAADAGSSAPNRSAPSAEPAVAEPAVCGASVARPADAEPAVCGASVAARPAAADSGSPDSGAPESGALEPAAILLEEEDQEELLTTLPIGEGTPLPAGVIVGRIAETLPPGPALAGWLATAGASELEDGALAGVAASYRRLAAWAQAGELAVVAQIASRAAARDEKVGVDDDGRPASISASACAEVSLGLAMSQYGASCWTDLGVTLRWRLPATGAALHDGLIDLQRARLIAEATCLLDDKTAQSVEQAILPRAGEQTTSQLRTALRKAVIAADPEGAERRRAEAERRAKVSLYGDQDNTATLLGSGLPTIQAAAAMSRITALARAMKSAGMPGGIDLLRAQVYLGLLLGTLPFIPPPEGAPPDPAGPDSADPDLRNPGPKGRGSGNRDGESNGSGRGRDDRGRDDWEDVPCPGDEDAPSDDADPLADGSQLFASQDENEDEDDDLIGATPTWPALPPVVPAGLARPSPADAKAACHPPSGLLDVILPWNALAGSSLCPGSLGRIGSITVSQARRLAQVAAYDPAAQWRIIVTNSAGQALAVARIPRRVSTGGSATADDPDGGSGLVGRVTLTISAEELINRCADGSPDVSAHGPPVLPGVSAHGPPVLPGGSGHDPPDALLAAALRAASWAVARAGEQAAADATAGGCAHAEQAGTYRPPSRLQEFVVARDLTCRFPSCGQPAWRADLDHTVPWPQGPTCRCNLGGLCRTHHLVKHHAGWKLSQVPGHGTFTWTTPSGRSYTVTPDAHPV